MANERASTMDVSSLWAQVAVITFVVGFGILGYLAFSIYHRQPPVPLEVVSEDGQVLFGRDDIMRGQHLFQKYGLMQFGTLFGHGAYLGPDFTAQYLDRAVRSMQRLYAGDGAAPEVAARIERELKANRYEEGSGRLVFTAGQAEAFSAARSFYRDWFGPPDRQQGLRRPTITDEGHLHAIAAYFAWASWVTTEA